MNELEKLNERITQLTELVKNGSEAIKAMEVALKTAEEERDRLADQRREHEPKFERVDFDREYYILGCDFKPAVLRDIRCHVDNWRYENNNYFHTEERAEEVADKIRLLLKLERLHDTFCPDYVPDLNDNEFKYFVFYDNFNKHYNVSSGAVSECKTDVYFATLKIARKVCDILNKELEEKSNES